MTELEFNKKNEKGFAGLSTRLSDVTEDTPSAAAAPQAVQPQNLETSSGALQPEHSEKGARGFAGLSSKVSDVSADTAHAGEVQEAHPPVPPVTDAHPQQPDRTSPLSANEASPPSPKSGKAAWGWGIFAITVFAIWMANSGSGHQGQPSSTNGPEMTPLTPIAPEAALDAAAQAVSDEQMPPIGRENVLIAPQIRWCKREKIRLDAIEGVVNNAREGEVIGFNARVDNYNSRCAEFRYRRGALEQIEREIAPEREAIASAAKREWVLTWAGISNASVPNSDPGSGQADELQPNTFGNGLSSRSEQAASRQELSQEEQDSIDSACADQKLVYGNTAYEKCAEKKKSALLAGPRNIDLATLNASERESIEGACSDQKIVRGPAEYNLCLVRKLSALKAGPRNIDLSDLSPPEQESIVSSCSDQKLVEGPAAYNRCLSRKLAALRAGPRNIDLSNLSEARRASIESACLDQKLVEGPAAYNRCLMQKIGRQ